jgi:imidazolonepropionase
MRADFILHDAAEILTCAGPAPRAGARQREAGAIRNGSIAAADGRIVFVGPSSELNASVDAAPGARVFDASGCAIVPGFVDPHTHLLYGGDRRHELRQRLGGKTYAEIAAAGGGIVSTVDATRAASEDELIEAGRTRLAEMLRCGTTTCEIKSGYGLSVEEELKMLRATAALASSQPIDVSPTFMGAHDVPREYRNRRPQYVDHVVTDMLPAVAAAGLAEWCDVFCEDGVFTPDETRGILQAARTLGFGLRVHADELASSGGARVAAELGVRSADHLVHVSSEDAARLAAEGVTATLLPCAAFYLKLGRFAPARMLIDAGVPVALATDVNPGGGLSPSMPFAIALACFAMNMTFEEALVGATLNAAWSLQRHTTAGSLEAGKRFDAVVVDGDAMELVRVGTPAIRQVITRGRIAHETRPLPLKAGLS